MSTTLLQDTHCHISSGNFAERTGKRGEKEKESSISAANIKIPAVESSIKASEQQKALLEEELKQTQIDGIA